jgi:SAM-dependent methyltransferase
MNLYTKEFYNIYSSGSKNSAKVIIPLLLDIYSVKSVIDVGCGIGTWLHCFPELGITDIFGVDGNYVDFDKLLISKNYFYSHDLNKPLRLQRKFDLVISLEVAEHLLPENSKIFVKSLTLLGDIVLFSAAVPFQGGENHINCQWPEYWANLFEEENYVLIDFIRKRVWNNPLVDHWYAQNILLFVRKEILDTNSILMKEYEATSLQQISIVHPKRYLELWNIHNSIISHPWKLLFNIYKKKVKLLISNLINYNQNKY